MRTRLVIPLAVCAVLVGLPASAQLTDAQVRAGLLYNFAAFVEWPSAAPSQLGPFVIGVVGADAVGDALREIEGRPIGGRPLEVRRIKRDEDVRGSHLLYISDTVGHWQRLLKDHEHASILTVGDHALFTQGGGVIRLYSEGTRLRFEVNVTRAQRAGLKISSRLLTLAKVVREP